MTGRRDDQAFHTALPAGLGYFFVTKKSLEPISGPYLLAERFPIPG